MNLTLFFVSHSPEDNILITMKAAIFSTIACLTFVVLLIGCSAGAGTGSGGGANETATAKSAAVDQAGITQGNGNIAGVLKWSGDSSGRHVYKTAECSAVPGGMLILDAPRGDKDLGLFDQPHLRIAFMGKEGKKIAVGFFPQPKNHTKQNSFIGSGKSAGSVSWSKKGNTYVVHFRHLDAISADIKDSPAEGYPEHDYHAYLTGDLACTKVNGDEVKG